MLVRTFEAEEMSAALQKVKQTLGSDALILSTRTVRKKGLGMLGKPVIEVTAAIESPAMAAAATSRPAPDAAPAAPTARKLPAAYSAPQAVEKADRVEVLNEPPQVAPRKETAPLEDELRSLRRQLEAQDVGELKDEIEQLKGLVRELTAPSGRRLEPPAAELPVSEAVAPPREAPPAPAAAGLEGMIELLLERGIDAEAATTIARFASGRMSERQRQEPVLFSQVLEATLTDLVQVSGPLWRPGEAPKRVALIGPTGVGKTTSIAKLAAEAIVTSGARVALVTIDTFRIAAVEQLKVYGEIMGLPVEVVISPEQLQEAFRRHRDKDLILIDTAGRSPRDRQQIDELESFLGAEAGVENCLVLAAPTADREQQEIVRRFEQLPLSRLIFTKLDECDGCGSLVNLPTRFNLPLAYLTNGQRVPEDLLLAEAKTVAGLVMGSSSEQARMAI